MIAIGRHDASAHGEIQAMAISLYIQQSKQANINLMHRNDTLRANGAGRVNGHASTH